MEESKTDDNHSWLKDGSTNSKEVAGYYDDWAVEYDKTLDEWEYQAPTDAAELFQKYVQTSGKILDAGCGTGLSGIALKRVGYSDITGIDISSKSIPIAERSGAYTRLLQQDLQEHPFPFATNEFDAVICIGVLSYVEDVPSLFQEFCRLVRPEGYIFFSHREDFFEQKNYPAILKALEEQNCWTNILTSEPKPYLPKNPDLKDTSVLYCLFQVRNLTPT